MSFLYLEIHDEQMILATNTIIKRIPFKNLEMVHGIIFNHHLIVEHLNNFLKTYTLTQPSTIVCMPSLLQKNDSIQPFLTLQTTLCIAHAKVKLEKIIAQSLLPDKASDDASFAFPQQALTQQKDFLSLLRDPQLTSPFTWLTASSIKALMIGCILTYFSLTISQQAKQMHHHKQALTLTAQQLEKKIHTSRKLWQETNELKAKIDHLKLLKNQTDHPSHLLLAFSTCISPECWLTNVKIEDNPKHQKMITLEGISHKPKAVSQFIKKLQAASLIKNLSLAKLTKEQKKRRNSQDHYAFKVNGIIG